MAHHWMGNGTDETEQVMSQRSKKEGYVGGIGYNKFDKKVNAEVDEGMARYNRAMRLNLDGSKPTKALRDIEEIVRQTLEALENMNIRNVKAINPRNTAFVQQIAKQIIESKL